jgi:NDP-sugar pyrophosphorylase family protein
MLPVANEPLLVHTLGWLKRYGITKIALNLHHLPEMIQDGLGDGSQWGMQLIYSFEPVLQGTAGAVKVVQPFFDETFVVVYGDLLVDIDLADLMSFHTARKALITIGLKHTDDPSSQGMVSVDSAGKLLRFVEKPAQWNDVQRTANAGIYIVEPEVINRIPANRPTDWGHDILPLLIAEGAPVYGQLIDGQLVDIGSHEVYERIRERGLEAGA